LREHLLLSSLFVVVVVGLAILAYRFIKKMTKEDKKLIIFGAGFMFLSLLPFLGLGNITSRYNYLVAFGFVILFALLAKKIYDYLINNGKDITYAVMTLFLGFFFLLHMIQIQQIHGDWHDAGLKVNKFFVSIEGKYLNYWSSEHIDLYFVNVPIRNGDAWVFPVGLNDAVWFAFRSPNIRVHQPQSLDDALNKISNPTYEKVFIFNDDGSITEKEKPKPKLQ
jgi:hypothetical protein